MKLTTGKKNQDQFTQDKEHQSFKRALKICPTQNHMPHSESHLSDSYRKVMKEVPLLMSHSDIQKQVNYNYHQLFCSGVHTTILKKYTQCNIFLIRVYFSYFYFDMYIHFCNGHSKSREYLLDIGRGGFGTIYSFDNKHAIKNIQFSKENKGWSVRKAIQQYCLYQLASNLKIGPKLTRLFGFDLIVYENCVQFTMQKCSYAKNIDKFNILQSIKLLHEFRIIHGDIKEENIMYSHEYERNVLIDFNCSTVIGEVVGQKTLTFFKGTSTRCHKEMQVLYLKKQPGYVDMYYNDVVCCEGLDENGISKKRIIEKKDNFSQMEEFICLIRHFNLRALLCKCVTSQIVEYIQKHAAELIPSKQLEDKLKGKITEKNRVYLSLYHQIYAEIIRLLIETYEIFRAIDLNKKTIKKQVFHSLFHEYINLQKVSLRLNEKKETPQDYISFSSLTRSTGYTYYIRKKIWFSRHYEVQLEPGLYFFSIKDALEKLKEEDIPEEEVKSLYYNILAYKPTKQQLKEVLGQVARKLGLKLQQTPPEKDQIQFRIVYSKFSSPYHSLMIHNDQHFKRGKFQKIKIWRSLEKFCCNRENLLGRIIAQICTIQSASGSFISHQFSIMYNVKGYIKELGYLRNLGFRLQTKKIFEKIIYRLIRILRDTTYINQKQLSLLTQTIKSSQMGEEVQGKYLQNVQILKYLLKWSAKPMPHDEISKLKFLQNFDQFWESKDLDLYSQAEAGYLYYIYLQSSEVTFVKTSSSVVDIEKIISHINKQCKSIDRENKWQVDHLFIITQALTSLNILLQKVQPKIVFTILEHWSYYFCTFQLSQLSHIEERNAVCQFNSIYFRTFSFFTPEINSEFWAYHQKYLDWLQRQYSGRRYRLQVYENLINIYAKHNLTEQFQNILDQCNQVYSIFDTIEDVQKLIGLTSCNSIFYDYLHTNKLSSIDMKPTLMEIFSDRSIYFQSYFNLIALTRYFFINKNYAKGFEMMESHISFSEQNQRYFSVLSIKVFISLFFVFKKNWILPDLLQGGTFYLYHKNHIMRLEGCSPSFASVNLLFVVQFLILAKQVKSACTKLAFYSYIEQCLIAIFRRIEQCPRFIRQRIIENIGEPLKCLYDARKKLQQKQFLNSSFFNQSERKLFETLEPKHPSPPEYLSKFDFKFHPLKSASLKALKIYHLRHSLLNTCMKKRKSKLIQICDKLCSSKKIRSKVASKYLQKKLNNLIDNKLKHGHVVKMYRNITFNSLFHFEWVYLEGPISQ